MLKRIAAALLVFSAVFAQSVLADEAEFQSSDFFMNQTAGLWLWQMYAETDKCYVETDMSVSGRKYLSTAAASRLPNVIHQEFDAVKTFVAPYTALAVISIQNVSIPDGAENCFRIRILKNETPVSDWADPVAVGSLAWIEKIEPKDELHFIVKLVGERTSASMEIKLDPKVLLITDSTYMKNAHASISADNHITDIFLTIANYADENTEGTVIAAMYCDEKFLGVNISDKVKAEKYKKQDIEIPVTFDTCNMVKLMYISDFNSICPLDFPVILNSKIGEES